MPHEYWASGFWGMVLLYIGGKNGMILAKFRNCLKVSIYLLYKCKAKSHLGVEMLKRYTMILTPLLA